MTRPSPFPSPPDRTASILPLRGSRAQAPSSVLVRARLDDGLDAGRVRAAVAFFAEVCDTARAAHGAEARWWATSVEVRVEDAAHGAAMSLGEAEAALADLESAQLLGVAERGYRIEADTLCECPALEDFDLDAARARLREQNQLVGPATAILREIARAADREGTLHTTIPRLLDATLYGRTRLTQALSVLGQARLVERGDLSNRMVRFQLIQDPAPSQAPAPRSPRSTAPGGAALGTRMRLPTNAPIEIGGEVLHVSSGIIPELELDADGRYYLWLGPVRVGPYEI